MDIQALREQHPFYNQDSCIGKTIEQVLFVGLDSKVIIYTDGGYTSLYASVDEYDESKEIVFYESRKDAEFIELARDAKWISENEMLEWWASTNKRQELERETQERAEYERLRKKYGQEV